MRVVSARPTLIVEGCDSCRGSIDTEESRFGETDTKKRANEIDEYSNEGHQRGVLRVRGAYEKPRASVGTKKEGFGMTRRRALNSRPCIGAYAQWPSHPIPFVLTTTTLSKTAHV